MIGHFQHGSEITEQQDELRRQSKANETTALLQHEAREREALREAKEAQPEFVESGGASEPHHFYVDILNLGGEVTDVYLEYDGPCKVSFLPPRKWGSRVEVRLTFEQLSFQPFWPYYEFRLDCTDRLGNRHTGYYELLGVCRELAPSN